MSYRKNVSRRREPPSRGSETRYRPYNREARRHADSRPDYHPQSNGRESRRGRSPSDIKPHTRDLPLNFPLPPPLPDDDGPKYGRSRKEDPARIVPWHGDQRDNRNAARYDPPPTDKSGHHYDRPVVPPSSLPSERLRERLEAERIALQREKERLEYDKKLLEEELAAREWEQRKREQERHESEAKEAERRERADRLRHAMEKERRRRGRDEEEPRRGQSGRYVVLDDRGKDDDGGKGKGKGHGPLMIEDRPHHKRGSDERPPRSFDEPPSPRWRSRRDHNTGSREEERYRHPSPDHPRLGKGRRDGKEDARQPPRRRRSAEPHRPDPDSARDVGRERRRSPARSDDPRDQRSRDAQSYSRTAVRLAAERQRQRTMLRSGRGKGGGKGRYDAPAHAPRSERQSRQLSDDSRGRNSRRIDVGPAPPEKPCRELVKRLAMCLKNKLKAVVDVDGTVSGPQVDLEALKDKMCLRLPVIELELMLQSKMNDDLVTQVGDYYYCNLASEKRAREVDRVDQEGFEEDREQKRQTREFERTETSQKTYEALTEEDLKAARAELQPSEGHHRDHSPQETKEQIRQALREKEAKMEALARQLEQRRREEEELERLKREVDSLKDCLEDAEEPNATHFEDQVQIAANAFEDL